MAIHNIPHRYRNAYHGRQWHLPKNLPIFLLISLLNALLGGVGGRGAVAVLGGGSWALIEERERNRR